MTGLYAYAFLPAGTELPDVRGVGPDGPPVRQVSRDGLAALVSDVDTARLTGLFDEDVTEDSELARWARTHDSVIRAAFACAAVLPFRFGTVLRDSAAADRLLAERYDMALTMLAHLRDRVEWGVRVHDDSPAPSDDARATDRTSGTAYLASRRNRLRAVDEHRARARDVAADVRDELAAWAADVVDRPRGALLDLAVLVDRSAVDEFHARAGQLATRVAEAGLVLDVTGPWPPYSFARTAPEVADA